MGRYTESVVKRSRRGWFLCVLSEPPKSKPEPKVNSKEKKPQANSAKPADAKPPGKSPVKKEKAPAENPAREPSPATDARSPERPGPSEDAGSAASPAHRLFQRTLSPADVLHVHSYAKGDYGGEGDAPAKEERKSDSSDSDSEDPDESPVRRRRRRHFFPLTFS